MQLLLTLLGVLLRAPWALALSFEASEEMELEPCLAPSPEQQDQEVTVAVGQPVQLCCGQAERGGHWYKEGSRLAPTGRVRGWRGRLEIASFLPQDAGRYLCLARGSMFVLHNVTLVVDDSLTSSNGDEDPKAHSGPSNRHVYPQHAPYWTHPQRMEKKLHAVPAGNTVKFRCPAAGNPMPTIRWLKDGQDFHGEHRIGGVRLRHQHWSLVMESVVPSDRGTYTCLVENSVGSISYNYLLDVLGERTGKQGSGGWKPRTCPQVGRSLAGNMDSVIDDSLKLFKCPGGSEGNTRGNVGLEEQGSAKKKIGKDIEAEGTGSVKALGIKNTMHLWGDVCLGCDILVGIQAVKGFEC